MSRRSYASTSMHERKLSRIRFSEDELIKYVVQLVHYPPLCNLMIYSTCQALCCV